MEEIPKKETLSRDRGARAHEYRNRNSGEPGLMSIGTGTE
jgi:hypothetical protein